MSNWKAIQYGPPSAIPSVGWCFIHPGASAQTAGGESTLSEAVLMQKLGRFVVEMHKKFKERAVKYSGNESITDDSFDWTSYPLHSIVLHFQLEIKERFPGITFLNASLSTRLNEARKMNEDIDIANMAFLDWAMRKARLEKAAQDERMREVLEMSRRMIKQ
jgi:hypothetical protein